MVKKKKSKTKIIYRAYKKPVEDTSKKYREEISELEERKKSIAQNVRNVASKKKGIGKVWTKLKGSIATGNLNKQISERRRAIAVPIQLQTLRKQVELEKVRNEIAEIRKKRSQQVSFESLGGSAEKKALRFEDLG